MALPLEWPDDIRVQFLICAGFVAATLMLARISWLRTVIVFVGAALLHATRLAAAGVIWLFDKVMPVDGRNGRLPRVNFAVWILLNATVVAAWIVTSEVPTAANYAFAAAVAAAVFTALNLLLLGASYWAVRETIEVTNGDLAPEESRFAEASPSRNVIFVAGTAMLLVMQIAVVVDWVQQARGVALVATDHVIAFRYLNFLLATVDALPLAALYVAPLSHHAGFATDLPGLVLARSLNAVGSILIVSTALSLIQQRLAFQRMVEGLVNAKDSVFPAALLARFKNAPSAIKGYVMSAFRSETDDDRRLRLACLAVARCSYTFPQVFASSYAHFSDRMRDEGAAIVADFIGDRTVTFYVTTLQNFFAACDQTWRHGGFANIEDRRRIAHAYLSALERLVELDANAADSRIRTVPAQKILIAAVKSRTDMALGERAAILLARVNSYEAVAPLLKAVVWFPEPTALVVLARITRTLGDRSIVFPPAKNLDLLRRMAANGRLAHRLLLSPAASASLDIAMKKLDARLAAASAEIERQTPARAGYRAPQTLIEAADDAPARDNQHDNRNTGVSGPHRPSRRGQCRSRCTRKRALAVYRPAQTKTPPRRAAFSRQQM